MICDDWWDLTESVHFVSVVANQVIKDPALRATLLKTQKYETLAIGIAQFYHLLAFEQTTIDTQTSVNTYLKNLMFNVHQTFLILLKITLSRINTRDKSPTSAFQVRIAQ